MAKIFVSYRRQDNPYVALSLKDHLERQFGGGSVFLDIDNIPFGVDFREHIDLAVQQCDVMLVLIGDAWLTVRTGKERNRLFEPQDFVRVEIEAAFRRSIPIVPVLCDDAEMPAEEHLPESIRNLVYRNSAELRAGRDFNSQMARLVESLGQFFQNAAGAGLARPIAATSEPPLETPPPRTQLHPVKQSGDLAATSVPQSANAAAAKSAESSPTRVRQAIREAFAGVSDPPAWTGIPKILFVESSIPKDKLRTALGPFPHVDASTVVLLYDTTMFRSAKNGLLLTENALCWNLQFGAPNFVRYEDVNMVELIDNDKIIVVNGTKLGIGHPSVGRALDRFLRKIAPRIV